MLVTMAAGRAVKVSSPVEHSARRTHETEALKALGCME